MPTDAQRQRNDVERNKMNENERVLFLNIFNNSKSSSVFQFIELTIFAYNRSKLKNHIHIIYDCCCFIADDVSLLSSLFSIDVKNYQVSSKYYEDKSAVSFLDGVNCCLLTS